MNMAESHLNPIERPAAPAGFDPVHGDPALAPAAPKIEVKNLNFYYGKYHALKTSTCRSPRAR